MEIKYENIIKGPVENLPVGGFSANLSEHVNSLFIIYHLSNMYKINSFINPLKLLPMREM